LHVFRLDTRDFPEAETLTVDAGACGSVAYTVISAPTGARRLAWRSSAGGIEHYTFPVEKSESVETIRQRAYGAEGHLVARTRAERRTVLVSAYAPRLHVREFRGGVTPDGDGLPGQVAGLRVDRQFHGIPVLRLGRISISRQVTAPCPLLGFARDPHTSGRFNASLHRAVLSAEGAKLLAGTVRLLKVSDEGYRIEIREGGARWAKNAARRVFSALGIDYHARLLPSTVSASWTDDSPVKFFPIRRDEYPQQNSPSDLLPAERILSVDDYHPFLHVATLVETIFAEAGYRIESNFTSSPEFRSLYMSGAYPSRDTAIRSPHSLRSWG